MGGIFKPGQLVEVDPAMLEHGERLHLYNVPGGIVRVAKEQVRAVGWLVTGDIALLVARERTRAGEVYVLGPNGGGWAPGAFLRILQSAFK